VAIPWRPIDGNAIGLQVTAQPVDVIHPIRQMPEVTATGVLLRVPVVGQFDHGRPVFAGTGLIFRSGEEDQGKTAFVAAFAADLDHTQQIAEEVKGFVEVADADHGVEVLHRIYPVERWNLTVRDYEGTSSPLTVKYR